MPIGEVLGKVGRREGRGRVLEGVDSGYLAGHVAKELSCHHFLAFICLYYVGICSCKDGFFAFLKDNFLPLKQN